MESTTARVFLLSKAWQDQSQDIKLRFFGKSPELGAVLLEFDRIKSVCFIDRDTPCDFLTIPYERKENPLRNPQGKDVDTLYFKRHRDLRHALEAFRLKQIKVYESDVDPAERFLMERLINAEVLVQGKVEKSGTLSCFLNPHLKHYNCDIELSTASLDIETGVSSNQLYSIAVHLLDSGNESKTVFMLGQRPTNAPDYLYCYLTEKELLIAFLNWFQQVDPDIIIGWNVVGFDLNFLKKKCDLFQIPFSLGRQNTTPDFFTKQSGGLGIEIQGRVVIDGPLSLKSAFYNFEDFRLETVAQEILGKGKTIRSTKEEKIAEIDRQFATDKSSLAEYNIQDCILVSEIFQKTGLLQQAIKRSKLSGMMLNQLGRSVASFDHIYMPRLHRAGYVSINKADVVEQGHSAGGYVLEPQAGIHDHVIVLDFKSLYPSIIQTFKIDPLSKYDSKIDSYITPYQSEFSRSRHILPEFIGNLLAERQKAKDQDDAHLSQAIKILMNSFYGVMGSFGCRFYHPDLPSTITGIAKFLLLESKAYIERFNYRVIYGDTDSLFVKLRPEDAQYYDIRGNELSQKLNRYWENRILREYAFESFLDLEYEKYFRKLLLPSMRHGEGGAKKRYAGILVEGEKENLHFTGMESVRSDWTQLAKDFQAELYKRVFDSFPVDDWIKTYISDLKNGRYDKKLIYRKRLRKATNEYVKNVPPHVKAAKLLKKTGYYISYLITLEGPQPVEMQTSKLDYQHYIDKQLEPIANSILKFIGKSFREINKTQLNLFD